MDDEQDECNNQEYSSRGSDLSLPFLDYVFVLGDSNDAVRPYQSVLLVRFHRETLSACETHMVRSLRDRDSLIPHDIQECLPGPDVDDVLVFNIPLRKVARGCLLAAGCY